MPAAALVCALLTQGQASAAPDEPTPEADLEETIDLEADSAGVTVDVSPAPVRPPASVPDPLSFRLRGWARTRASTALRGDDASRDGGPKVPFEPALGEQQLFLELRAQHGSSFEVLASGLLWYTLAAHREPAPGAAPTTSARALFEPSLREAYAGFIGTELAARLGLQRVAWGEADAFPVNDVVNPRDLRDPLLAEADVLRIPSAAARIDLTLARLSLQLVLVPFFVPDRVDAYGTNWAFVGPRAPAGLRGAFAQLAASADPTLREPNQWLLRQTSLPPDDLSASAAGLRASWSAAGIDVAHFYHYGYTTAPALRIEPALAQQIATTDWTMATPERLGPLLAARNNGALSSTYERRHHAGLSVTTTAGPFVLRGEGAYDSAQVFYQPSLLSSLRPSAQGLLGLEYQPGELGKAIILELMSQRVLGSRPPELLGAAVATHGAAAILRWTFFEHLTCELRAVTSLHPDGLMLRPQLAYKQGAFELRSGVVWLDGAGHSRERYFQRNSSAYLIGKAHF